jgi:hypothetical protein
LFDDGVDGQKLANSAGKAVTASIVGCLDSPRLLEQRRFDARLLGRGRVLLFAARYDFERAIRKWTLQLLGHFPRRSHPRLDFGRRGQDDRHGLGVDGPHLGIGLGREEREQVRGDDALLDLADALPLGNRDPSEEGQGSAVIKGVPDIAALIAIELAERRLRENAPKACTLRSRRIPGQT